MQQNEEAGAASAESLPDDHTPNEAPPENPGQDPNMDVDAERAAVAGDVDREGNSSADPEDLARDDGQSIETLAEGAPLPAEVEAPQELRVRVGKKSPHLGMVIQRAGGGFTTERLRPRVTPELTLNAGDSLTVVTLGGRDAAEFQRLEERATDGGDAE